MYILLVSSWYPSIKQPSYGIFVAEQAKMLKSKGHRVEVLQPYLTGRTKDFIKNGFQKSITEEWDGIPVHRIPVNVILPGIKSLYYGLLSRRCIRFANKRFGVTDPPHIIHSHSAFCGGVIGLALTKHFKIPLVHTEHSSGFIFNPEQYNRIDRVFFKRIATQAKTFLFVSRFAGQETQARMSITIPSAQTVPNVVENSFFTPALVTNPIYDALCIGNFLPVKNQLFLLVVWQQIVQVVPETQLTFAGMGFDSPLFTEKVKSLGLEKNIRILPRLTREGVKQAMATSKMVLSASRVETFGLTLAEALAMGIPVVATDSGGPRDIILSGDGFLVPPNNPEVFAQAVLKVLQGEHDSPEHISQRCRSRFGEDVIYNRLMAIYQTALS